MEFVLSLKTTVEVKVSQFGGGHYLKCVKSLPATVEKEPLQRWFNMNSSTWQALCSLIPAIETNLGKLTEGSVTMKLPGTQRLVVALFQDNYYVGVYKVDNEGVRVRGSGINLIYEEWMELLQKKKQISDALKAVKGPMKRSSPSVEEPIRKKTKKVKKDTRRVVMAVEPVPEKITLYQWHLPEAHGKFWFFTEKDCMADFKEWPGTDCDGEVKVTVETREVDDPTPENWMRLVYTYMLHREIETLSHAHCVGCRSKCGSQCDHMFGGCLDEWEDIVAVHVAAARLTISKDRLVLATHTIMNIVSPKTVWGGEIMASSLLSLAEKEVVHDLVKICVKDPMQDEYNRLFSMKLADV
jgi:hypothetical protein